MYAQQKQYAAPPSADQSTDAIITDEQAEYEQVSYIYWKATFATFT
jgi:hypothetical protein